MVLGGGEELSSEMDRFLLQVLLALVSLPISGISSPAFFT